MISRSIDKTKELQASSLHWTCASYPVISDIFHTIRNLNRISLLKAEKVIKLRYVYWLWRVSIASKVIFYKKRPMGHIVHLNNNVIIWFESGQRSYDINYNTIQDYMHEFYFTLFHWSNIYQNKSLYSAEDIFVSISMYTYHGFPFYLIS